MVTTDINKMGGLPLAVAGGGTGTATAPAVGSIPVGSSTSAYTPLAIGANNTVLTSNGTTASWQAPASSGLSYLLQGQLSTVPTRSTTVSPSSAQTLLLYGSPYASMWTIGANSYSVPANQTVATNETYNGSTSVSVTTAYTPPTSWTVGTNPAPGYARMGWGNGLFVWLTTSTTGYTSTNGSTWTSMTIPNPSSNQWNTVQYGNGYFLATSGNGPTQYCIYSSNGTTWTVGGGPTSLTTPWAVCYGNGYWVATISGTTKYSYYSTNNGASWTQGASTIPTSSGSSMTYWNGKYYTISAGVVYYSTTYNGASWTAMSGGPGSFGNFSQYNPTNVLVTSGPNGDSTGSYGYTTNGTSWSSGTFPVATYLNGIGYTNGYYFILPGNGYTSSTTLYGTNGTSWTVLNATSQIWTYSTAGGGIAVIISGSALSYANMSAQLPLTFTMLPGATTIY
jgi:hypothetical protein